MLVLCVNSLSLLLLPEPQFIVRVSMLTGLDDHSQHERSETLQGWLKCSTFCSHPSSFPIAGLIVVNAWYGKFVNDQSRKNEKVKVIDVTVPLQCLVKDSKLILTETSKVRAQPCPASFLTAIKILITFGSIGWHFCFLGL